MCVILHPLPNLPYPGCVPCLYLCYLPGSFLICSDIPTPPFPLPSPMPMQTGTLPPPTLVPALPPAFFPVYLPGTPGFTCRLPWSGPEPGGPLWTGQTLPACMCLEHLPSPPPPRQMGLGTYPTTTPACVTLGSLPTPNLPFTPGTTTPPFPSLPTMNLPFLCLHSFYLSACTPSCLPLVFPFSSHDWDGKIYRRREENFFSSSNLPLPFYFIPGTGTGPS